nr:MAG TPA: hypothetical protein [Caudoviricetes sp.]
MQGRGRPHPPTSTPPCPPSLIRTLTSRTENGKLGQTTKYKPPPHQGGTK